MFDSFEGFSSLENALRSLAEKFFVESPIALDEVRWIVTLKYATTRSTDSRYHLGEAPNK